MAKMIITYHHVAGKGHPISKFHVADPNKLEEPFVVTGHYIDSDFWGTWEEHNVLKVFPNEGFGWSDIEKEASVAIDATVALLSSSGARVTNDRTKTMVQYRYTASTISLPGVYITSFVHDPRKPGSAVKNIKALRINQGVFAENQQPAFDNIKAKKDEVKMHEALLTSLWMQIPAMEPFVLCRLRIIYVIVVSLACSMEPMRMNITTWESDARCNRWKRSGMCGLPMWTKSQCSLLIPLQPITTSLARNCWYSSISYGWQVKCLTFTGMASN